MVEKVSSQRCTQNLWDNCEAKPSENVDSTLAEVCASRAATHTQTYPGCGLHFLRFSVLSLSWARDDVSKSLSWVTRTKGRTVVQWSRVRWKEKLHFIWKPSSHRLEERHSIYVTGALCWSFHCRWWFMWSTVRAANSPSADMWWRSFIFCFKIYSSFSFYLVLT